MIKRILVGKPIPTAEEHRSGCPRRVALPVFSSDAISSTAYATEEILIVLVGAGVGVAASFVHLDRLRRGRSAGHRRALLPADHPRLSVRVAAPISSAPRTWAGCPG